MKCSHEHVETDGRRRDVRRSIQVRSNEAGAESQEFNDDFEDYQEQEDERNESPKIET